MADTINGGLPLTDAQLKAQAAQKMSTADAQAARDAATAAALKSSTTMDRYTSQQPADVTAQAALNTKYGLDPMAGFKGAPIDMLPGQTMARNFEREQAMANKLGITNPTEDQQKNLFKAVYTPEELKALGLDSFLSPTVNAPAATPGDVSKIPPNSQISSVDQFMNTLGLNTSQTSPGPASAETLAAMGLTPEVINGMVQQGQITPELAKQLQTVGGQKDTAAAALGATPAPTNAGLGVLEAALREKSGVGNQPIGESDLFKQAGLSGYAVLAQSLNQHSAEMGQKYNSYANLVSTVGDQMASVYNKALEGYKASNDSFNTLANLTMDAKKRADDWDHALQTMQLQHDLDMEKEQFVVDHQDHYELKQGTDMWGQTTYSAFNKQTGQVDYTMDSAGNISFGANYKSPAQKTGTNNADSYPTTTADGFTVDKGQAILGDKIVDRNIYDMILGVGKVGDWCGVYASKYSTASSVGDTWGEKRQHIEATPADIASGKYTPKLGDKLLVGIGVKTGKGYGHVALVTGYDPQTGDIYVTESNRDGRQNRGEGPGVTTEGKYNVADLIGKKYGNGEWGIAKGELKSDLNKKIDAAQKGLIGTVFSKSSTPPQKLAAAFAEMGLAFGAANWNMGKADISGVPGQTRPELAPVDKTTPTLPTGSLLDKEQQLMETDPVFKGIPDFVKSDIQAAAHYAMAPSDITSYKQGGRARQMVTAAILKLNPGWTIGKYDAAKQTQADWYGDPSKPNTYAYKHATINTAIYHLGELYKAYSQLGNGQFPSENAALNWVAQQTGDPDITSFGTVKEALKGELSKIYKGGVATEGELANVGGTIDASQSPEQMKAGIASAMALIGGRLKPDIQQYQNLFGKPPDEQVLNPEAVQILQDMGLDASKYDPTVLSAGGDIEALAASKGFDYAAAIADGVSPQDIADYLNSH